MTSQLLLDTCAAIWLSEGARLSAPSLRAMQVARSSNLGIHLSPFTAWEVGTLVRKKRIFLAVPPLEWFESVLTFPGLRLSPITADILVESTALPGVAPSDTADRIIAATARLTGLHRLYARWFAAQLRRAGLYARIEMLRVVSSNMALPSLSRAVSPYTDA